MVASTADHVPDHSHKHQIGEDYQGGGAKATDAGVGCTDRVRPERLAIYEYASIRRWLSVLHL
jgi:hypothetical protein